MNFGTLHMCIHTYISIANEYGNTAHIYIDMYFLRIKCYAFYLECSRSSSPELTKKISLPVQPTGTKLISRLKTVFYSECWR